MQKDDGLTLRERIAARGVGSLSDSELLAVVMGEDTATTATTDAERLLEAYGGQLGAICGDDIRRMFAPRMEGLQHEECWAIYLTASNRIVDSRRVSQGGVSGTVVDHRLVVKRALELLVPQIIVVHNHPSGSAQPSVEDDRVTQRLKEAASLFDIRLLDHIIIARGSHFSYAAEGRL